MLLWSVSNMLFCKMFGISQAQRLFGRMPIDMLGVENAYFYMKL